MVGPAHGGRGRDSPAGTPGELSWAPRPFASFSASPAGTAPGHGRYKRTLDREADGHSALATPSNLHYCPGPAPAAASSASIAAFTCRGKRSASPRRCELSRHRQLSIDGIGTLQILHAVLHAATLRLIRSTLLTVASVNYAADCKSAIPGSNPGGASLLPPFAFHGDRDRNPTRNHLPTWPPGKKVYISASRVEGVS